VDACDAIPDLMLYYDFDDRITDQSGQGRNGSSSKTPTYVTGMRGKAIYFDGSYKLTVSNGPALGPTTSRARTVSFWLDTGAVGYGSVVGQYQSNPATDTFEVGYHRPGGYFLAAGVGTDWLNYDVGGSLQGWHHWAVVFAPGTNNVRIYMDGALVAVGTLTLNANESTLAVTVGALAATGRNLVGAVDDLSIYSRALTETEIASLVLDLAISAGRT